MQKYGYNDSMKKILNMRDLKLIAYVTMLIDHIGAVLVEEIMTSPRAYGVTLNANVIYNIYFALRLIGRFAFPIFAFSIYEGFNKTRDVKKYMLRLFLFAIISEIPFDLAIRGSLFDWSYQNVIWTFLFALMGLYIYEKYENLLIKIFAIGGTLALGELFHTDYGSYGVAMIYVFYFLKDNETFKNVLLAGLLMMQMAILALIPLNMYNGEKGMKSGRILYYFYPGHLLILYFILLAMRQYFKLL